MKRFVESWACLVMFGLLASVGAQSPITTPYYPLTPNTKWTYKVMGNEIVMRVAGYEKVGDVNCAKIETLVNDKVQAFEHVAVMEDGVYRYSINGQRPDTPVRFLKLPPKEGDTWKVETKIQNQPIKGEFTTRMEKVKVGNKEYEAIVIDGPNFKIADMNSAIKYWFAKDVGIIKLSFTLGGNDATLELEKYELGK